MVKVYKSDKNKVLKSEKNVYCKSNNSVYKKVTKAPKQQKYSSNQFPAKQK